MFFLGLFLGATIGAIAIGLLAVRSFHEQDYADGYRHGTADADKHWTAKGAVWRPMPHV